MENKIKLISDKTSSFLHGADYFPEQWELHPEIIDKDIQLMKIAKCNVVSIGMFAWSRLESEEGVFSFEWLDNILDKCEKNGIYVFLATPSGARPAWMSEKYPEVLRVAGNRVRNLHGFRHNHCFTSPVYREKTLIINQMLADKYATHPAVIGWHVSNEYGGECHCNYCQDAFRLWLKNKYKELDDLNEAWWTTFWSHTYTDWSQIESPAPHGEMKVHGLNLDWKRFTTDRTIDFFKHEIKPLKQANTKLPVNTNFMEMFDGLDYSKFAKELDFVSWDSYPKWHEEEDDINLAAYTSMNHDWFRSLKDKPFLLMESTPSTTNWHSVSKLKKPGMHYLSSLQAIAHGSDSIQYFQWRKSRGASEKFHGAVVDHVGSKETRVFKEVTQIGEALEKIERVVGTNVDAEVAIIFDTENRWSINDAEGPRNIGIKYEKTVAEHYKAFWDQGVPVDVIDMDRDLSKYKIVIAPMLYMVRNGVSERIEKFVEKGGIFVTTYWSGIVDENDLCFLGGFPGPLRRVLGVWSEEIDGLYDGQTNSIEMKTNNELGLNGEYIAHELCDIIHLEGAKALAYYTEDFYAGNPALTVNHFGEGKAFYIASRNKEDFNRDFFTKIIKDSNVKRIIEGQLPEGVTAQMRTDGKNDYIFLLNFSANNNQVELQNVAYIDMITEESVSNIINLPPYGASVLERKSNEYSTS